MPLAELQHGHQLPTLSGTGTLLDQDDDYCKTYAVLVEGLKQLLGKLDTEGTSPQLQLELHNQTRAAVSGFTLWQKLLTQQVTAQSAVQDPIARPQA